MIESRIEDHCNHKTRLLEMFLFLFFITQAILEIKIQKFEKFKNLKNIFFKKI